MGISPYLIFISVILVITASYIFYTQFASTKTVRVHGSTAVLPDMAEPLPIVTEPPFHLQPIVEERGEGFSNYGVTRIPSALLYEGGSATLPSQVNPFMNVLIPEIKYDPTRPAAAPINDPAVKQSLDDFFRTNFYNDPTDVFGKAQDQRQFITQPSTSVPNDRESYQNWLYNIVPDNCKSGGRAACLPGTDGGPITSLNQLY